ncbi:MAG: TPM domain-containing protein [bacterium]
MRHKLSSSLILLSLILPTATGYINDFAGILSNASYLEQQIIAFEQETSNEISIVSVESLQDETIEEYAVRLFEKWQIGKADKDNGVLILIAPNEKEVRIEVGYGLEGVLPDSLANLIIQKEILPAFKKGDYQQGVEAGLQAVMQAIRGEYQAEQNIDWQSILINIFVFIIFIILIIFLSRKNKGKNSWPWFLLGMFFGRGSSGSSGSRSGFSGFSGGSSGGGGASGRW